MRKLKLRRVATGLVLVLMAVVGALILSPRSDPIMRGKCQQIRAGMSMGEAEAILGLPGDYSTKYYRNGIERHLDYHHTLDASGLADVTSGKLGTTTHRWQNETTIVEVHYCRDGRVAAVDCYSYEGRDDESPDNLLSRAKRQWRRWFPE